jgi:hypothetical protein
VWDEEVDVDWAGLAIAPDGDRLALRRTDGSPVMLSCGTGAARPIAGIAPGETIVRFDASGRSLYVGCVSGGAPCIERLDLESRRREPCRTLRPPDPTGILYLSSPVVTPDGDRHAYAYLHQTSDLYLVEGLA